MLIPMSEEELKLYIGDLYELQGYLDKYDMSLAGEEVERRRKKLQACLKGEEGLSEDKIGVLIAWGIDEESINGLAPFEEEIMEMLKGYLGECE